MLNREEQNIYAMFIPDILARAEETKDSAVSRCNIVPDT